MASLGALVIELAANTARLQSDMGKAVNIAQAGARRFQSVFRGVAALAGAGSLGAVVMRSIQMGDELQKAAIKAGVSGRTISELAHAAKMADIDLASLSNSLRFMQVNLSKAASGAKEPREALAALGLTIKDLAGKSADLQLEIIAEQISRLSSVEDRARVATELFGRAGADLLPLFEEGARGIRQAREEAQKLGQSFTDQQLKRLADADDAIKRLSSSWEGFWTAAVSKGAPALSLMLDALHGELPKNDLATQIAYINYQMDMLAGTQTERGLRKLDELRGKLLQLQEQQNPYEDFAARRSRAMSAGPVAAPGYAEEVKQIQTLTEIVVTNAKIRTDAMTRYYDSINEMTMTTTERQLQDLADIEVGLTELVAAGRISAEQYAERWREALEKVLEKVEVTNQKIGTMPEKVKTLSDEATRFAQDAQYAFQKFFFEPTHKGIKGLAKDLLDSLRWSIAQIAAEKMFKAGAGGFFAGAFKGLAGLLGFANGGRPPVGRPSIVGERGPELFVPDRAGTVIPNNRLGGGQVVINNHIDARGSTVESVKLLQAAIPAVIRQAVNQARVAVRDDVSRGVFG